MSIQDGQYKGGWNKGLTKETDERVKKSGEKVSAARQKVKYPAWNKGLTKDTDDRMKVCAENAKANRVYELGLIPWNKGLTKETNETVALVASKVSKTRKEGFKSGRLKAPDVIGRSQGRSGYRSDLGHFVRSSWEANFARLMVFLGVEYRYEYKVFIFSDDDTYRPDFYLPHLNSWVEIKGHWFEEAIKKVEFFHREYPEEKLDIIERTPYIKLQRKFAKYIPNWEF